MSDRFFLFDLDSTLTRVEILPTLAREAGCEQVMRDLTEKAMYEAIPFRQSFLERVALLQQIPVSQVRDMVTNIPLNDHLVKFIQENRQRCFIVTGNLDVWISGLMERMGIEGNVYCSRGIVEDDRLLGVASVIDKNTTVDTFVNEFAAIGDGSNDAQMVSRAEIGIGFGGVRPIAPSLLEVANYAFYDEEKLCQFLNRLL